MLEDNCNSKRDIAIVGSEPETLLLGVLFSEAAVPTYLVGPFEGASVRNSSSTWDEARWLLNLHQRSGRVRQVANIDELPISEVHTIIVTGHATSYSETSDLERTVRAIAKNARENSNLIFAGLCKPGYTLGAIRETVERYSGMSVGSEIGLCYIPLLWNGEPTRDFSEKPIIMAASSEKAALQVQETLLQIFPAMKTTPNIPAAEAAGLFAPVYREVVGALELELANLCQSERVDYEEAAELCKVAGLRGLGPPKTTPARDAVASKIALSTAGVSGSRLIRTARQVNERAPLQILALIKNALALCGRRVKHSRIAILGLKGLQSASSSTPTPPPILQTLRRRGATVSLYPGENVRWAPAGYSESLTVENTIPRAIRRANCAVIALDSFSVVDLNPQILASEMVRPGAICDLTRVLEASNVERAGLFYTSIGRGTPEE